MVVNMHKILVLLPLLILIVLSLSCANLVAYPFGVLDLAVSVATLGKADINTSGAVMDAIDPERVKRREERREAMERRALEQAAPKQNEEKVQNSDNKQVASSQDKNPIHECIEGCFRIYEKSCFREPSEDQKIPPVNFPVMARGSSMEPGRRLHPTH